MSWETIDTDRLHPVVAQAVAITRAHQTHAQAHPALREAACLQAQFPHGLGSIAPGDLLAGAQAADRIVYVGSMWWAMMPDRQDPGKQGGYCCDFAAAARYREPADAAAVQAVLAYWQDRATWARISQRWPEELTACIHQHGQISGGGSGFALALDLDPLLREGLPGLQQRIAQAEMADHDLHAALRETVTLLLATCRYYQEQAQRLCSERLDEAERLRLHRIAASLEALQQGAPANLHEAMQLYWLVSLLAGGRHIECWRPDVALGDFYAADIDSGRLSQEQADALVLGLWRQIARHGDPAVCRLLIGGVGRRNPEQADRFCLAAIAATRRHREVIPQLSLRFHKHQDPGLLQAAYAALGDGGTYPMLFNDDAIVPGIEQALHVPRHDAERYHPLGCGEYMIAGMSPSLLNHGWSFGQSFHAALWGGRDAAGHRLSPQLRQPADRHTLRQRLHEEIANAAELAAQAHAINNAVLRQDCAFLFASLLLDDCLARGASLFDGGVRYQGACVMAHGMVNVADGLVALEQHPEIDATTLRTALATDFDQHPELLTRLQAAPKFGNDLAEVDAVTVDLWRLAMRAADAASKRHGLDFLTVSSVNPGGYDMGAACGATPDGRHAGTPFAIGTAPSAGADRSGLTALLNSLARIDPVNGGVSSNIKLAKTWFSHQRPALEALCGVFWQQGGMQATLTVVDQRELEEALDHPERHPHLLVRVGGWSARFVDLDRPVQEEIIRRTVHC
jgi:pyruvate-formate lyase